ncbi:tRNA-dihydrouridine(16/17) synthase [NAD(P)(+)]-like [Galendromus occidentalis]|uniref:tRNA-dihydrouridine(16/17) synthase [NAD(P)(+)] n=1 Tax=Galendromus occidentalis TaxID=34638 RepID=A0AAJ6VXV4_9ACAR|nr:tRNA-dihydrouridine(16/17) synthase [NAD(P)(+)]-like [Galendromus occidentalis]
MELSCDHLPEAVSNAGDMDPEARSGPQHPGYTFFRQIGSPKYIVAPMVDASELAWRLLSRQHSAQLCYTPMYHAKCFVNSEGYRKTFATCAEDRPLIVQFCANDPEVFSQACGLVADRCDAVDLNLGCPQAIASAGHFGAFLQDEWELITSMISRARRDHPNLPITAKIRVFKDIRKTVEYAKILVEAGVSILTVHGRTRDMKGRLTGVASWDHIKAVKESVPVPIFANGNIRYFEDIQKCLQETGADGVMTAEGNLYNPSLFTGRNPPVVDVAQEYLDLVIKNPCPVSYIRGHLFKLFHEAIHLAENRDVRERLASAKSIDDFLTVNKDMRERLKKASSARRPFTAWELKCGVKPIPIYRCQPYLRPDPEESSDDQAQRKGPSKTIDQMIDLVQDLERPADVDLKALSKNKLKKLMRYPRRSVAILSERTVFSLCKGENCKNPKGIKCTFAMCRACCRSYARLERLTCETHHAFFAESRNTGVALPRETQA